jgi:excisionase family DNA binding protein
MAEDKVERLKKLSGGSRYTVGQLAQAAEVSELTIRRYISIGDLRAFKVGGRLWIPEEDAVVWLKGRETAA